MRIKLFLFLLISGQLYGMDVEQGKKLIVYAIPGQNGAGSEDFYVKRIIQDNNVPVIPVETPAYFPDLGQSHCMSYLDKAIKKEKKPGVVYATSQGTATALNYVAHKDKDRKIKALVLEAVLGSGNSAVYHTLTASTGGCFSYYWLPYTAKILFPRYSPWGTQAITSLKKIPNDLPVVIIHSKQDMQLSFNDACALYYGLRAQGNNNVYFLPQEGFAHLQILQELSGINEGGIVRAILKKNNLLPKDLEAQEAITEDVLKKYQPEVEQYKQCYDNLVSRERKHTYIGRVLGLGLLGACAYMLKIVSNKYNINIPNFLVRK